jgi:F-box interacting protein
MHMPHELMIQILLRLPVKSLISFKCVCKSWFSLISDPHFANSHFQITAATQTSKIVLISNPDLETRTIDYEAYDSASLNLSFVDPQSHSDLEIKGSCRGFIFFHCSSTFYLWNPSTGLHKQIPLSPNDSRYVCYLYGFGYDQLRDDYLVVSIYYDSSVVDRNYSRLEFFSLRDNMWKELEGTHFPYLNANEYNPGAGFLFNGAIHWLAFSCDLLYDVIVAFDLIEKKLLDIHLPDDFIFDHDPNYYDLWVFGEFLSLWAMDEATVEIWVMKEYKVHSSWTKTLVLPIDGIPTQYFYPLCCTKCGDIIGTDGGNGLAKYDENGELLDVHSYFNNPCGSRAAMYTESLLSLLGDNEQA